MEENHLINLIYTDPKKHLNRCHHCIRMYFWQVSFYCAELGAHTPLREFFFNHESDINFKHLHYWAIAPAENKRFMDFCRRV